MRLVEFIERNPEVPGLYVGSDTRWFTEPRNGFEYRTREQILGTVPTAPEETEAPAAPEKSKKSKNQNK